MKKVLVTGSLLLFAPLPAWAADVFAVHGINGEDIGLTRELPVDVSVSGNCALTSVMFGDVPGPLTLDPGRYDVEVRVSDGNCTGALAVTKTVDLALGENASIVAHVTEEGVPVLTKFVNDVRDTSDDNARIVVRHAAAAAPVDVQITAEGQDTLFLSAGNGEQRSTEVAAGAYQASAFIGDELVLGSRVFGPLDFTVTANTAFYAHAVGSLKNGSVELIVQSIDLTGNTVPPVEDPVVEIQ